VNRWNLEEEKYLIDKWGQVDISIIIEVLKRTEDSIIRKAQRLGVYKNKTSSESLKKKWSTDEENILYEYYNVKPMQEILSLLPYRTRESIIKKAKLLGLNTENKHWSSEEVAYLEEKWGIIPIENIAKKLGRTKNGILLKAHKIGLREQVIANGEYLTPKNISSLLGVGIRTIYNWMYKGYLKHRKLKINSVKKYQVTIYNFKIFLEHHQDKWDTRTADLKFINTCFITLREKGSLEIPEWLIRKIEWDKQKKVGSSRKQWTIKEEMVLRSLINGGKSCKEIAALLNRSFYSVQGKITSRVNQTLSVG
jgi:transposase